MVKTVKASNFYTQEHNVIEFIVKNILGFSMPSMVLPIAFVSLVLFKDDIDIAKNIAVKCVNEIHQKLEKKMKKFKDVERLISELYESYAMYARLWNKALNTLKRLSIISFDNDMGLTRFLKVFESRSSSQNFAIKLCNDILYNISGKQLIQVNTAIRILETLTPEQSLIIKIATFFFLFPLYRLYLPTITKFIIVKAKTQESIVHLYDPLNEIEFKISRQIDDCTINLLVLAHILAQNGVSLSHETLYHVDQRLRALAMIAGLRARGKEGLKLSPQGIMLALDLLALRPEYVLLSYVYRLLNIISPFDIVYFTNYLKDYTLDNLYQSISRFVTEVYRITEIEPPVDELIRSMFIRAVAGLHYMFRDELRTTFSEAFGPGWNIPGVIRAYAIHYDLKRFNELIALSPQSLNNTLELIKITIGS